MTATKRLTTRATQVLLLTLAVLAVLPLSPAAQAATPPTKGTEFEELETADAGAAGPSGAVTSAPVATPMPFSLVGFTVPSGATAEFRTSVDGGAWDAWTAVEPTESGPDAGTAEAAADAHNVSEPYWVEEAAFLQVRVDGARPENLTAHLVDSNGLSITFADQVRAALARPWIDLTPAPAQAAGKPNVITREQWGANESWRANDPSYAADATVGVVHHTAGSNYYSDGKAVVRGIYRYHTHANGWSDIGYNLLVDKWGNVYEGRAGGLERAVIGAHAAGYNTGSVGISVLGNLDVAQPSTAAVSAVARALAWKFQIHGIDPNRIVGHRDVGQTACPGRYLYARLPRIKALVADLMGVSFDDIGGLSHRPHILRIARAGLTVGCGNGRSYCPFDEVTRAQMATFLLRAKSLRPDWGRRFRDVPATHTHGPDINAIHAAKITVGCGRDRQSYCPRRGVTRAEMATFLVRAIPRLEPIPTGNAFRDVPAGSSHRPAINAIAAAGITQSCNAANGGTRFCPDRVVTRAEMATFISRSLDRGLAAAD